MNIALCISKAVIGLGFWCLFTCACEAKGAELALSALRSNATLVLSWPTEYVGYYYLQQAATLPATWIMVPNSFATNRMFLSIDISAGTARSRFYRLASVATADPQISREGLFAEYLLNAHAVDSVVYQGRQRNGSIQPGVSFTTNRFGISNSACQFNGTNGFIEVPDDDHFSISTTREFSISAWMRPDTDTFPKSDGRAPGHWVYWMSKVQTGNNCDPTTGSQDEWAFRMYNKDSGETEPDPGTCGSGTPGGRPNWVSIYAFNLCAPTNSNFGAGSRTQCSPAIIGDWAHYVATFRYTGLGITNGQIKLYKLYKNGGTNDTDPFLYNGSPITPANGKAPVRFGKGSGDYFFQGAIDNIRFYNRVLTTQEVVNLFHDQAP